MGPAEHPVRDLPDRAIRKSLRDPENLRAFLQQAVPALAAGFDCSQARLLDREFPTDDWRRREADLPFEVPYRTAAGSVPALVVVLIEHQSDTDPLMPLRLLYFAVVYWDSQWREWEQQPPPRPPLRLRPVLPIVLYTGALPWGSNRTLLDLFGEADAFRAFVPAWQPLFWNLAEQTPEQLLASDSPWMQLLAVLRVEQEDVETFRKTLVESIRRLEASCGDQKVRWSEMLEILWAWIYWRRPAIEQATLLAAARAAPQNPLRQQEIEAMNKKLGPSAGDLAVEEGVAKGKLQALRETLRQLLEDRFGAVPDALVQRIEASTNSANLSAAIRQVSHIQSLDDLQL